MEMGESSRESEFVVFKERKLVATKPVLDGMARLSLLIEMCIPGSVPDAHLLASVLDLVSLQKTYFPIIQFNRFQPNSTVVARAALLLECSYYVHCCNKGQWPTWMRWTHDTFRPSGPLPAKAVFSSLKRPQRVAAKMFYQWAEVSVLEALFKNSSGGLLGTWSTPRTNAP